MPAATLKMRPAAPTQAARESGLELLRILCMLFIIADHYAGQSGAALYDTLPHAMVFSALGAGSRLGCDIFVVLGAWFLCRQPFQTRRALALWLGLWLYTVPLTLLCKLVPGSDVGLGTLRWAMFPVSTQQLWFVAQYLLLLLLSPALNLLLRAAPRRALRAVLAVGGAFLVGYPTLFAEDGIFGDWLWSFVFLYLLTGYLRFYPGSRLAKALRAPAAPWLALGFVALLTAGRGVAAWLGVGGKLAQYLEYYRTALGAAPNVLCALAFFLPRKGCGWAAWAGSTGWPRPRWGCTSSTRRPPSWACCGQSFSAPRTMPARRCTRCLSFWPSISAAPPSTLRGSGC